MATTIGQEAELKAIEFIEDNFGWEIVSQNWKTKFCEIDIVAKEITRPKGIKNKLKRSSRDQYRIHFIEVKYRAHPFSGRAVEYVTKLKQRQLKFGAQLWVKEHDFEGDYQIDVCGIEGNLVKPDIAFIPNAIIND